MNLTHTDSFAVFPQDCNYHYPMVFGGKMLAEMDRTAATTVRRFLYDSPTGAKHALTVGVNNMIFHAGAKVGDLVFLTGTIIDVGKKRVIVKVKAERENHTFKFDNQGACNLTVRELMAEGDFAFCAYDMDQQKSMEHGMKLDISN